MSFQVEFVRFDRFSSAPRAIECSAKQFDTIDLAFVEVESLLASNEAEEEAEGFRIIENGALIVAEGRFAPSQD